MARFLAVLLVAAVVSFAQAALGAADLLKLTARPMLYKPNSFYPDTSVNAGTRTNTWIWGSYVQPTVQLRQLDADPRQWSLLLSSRSYDPARITPERRALFVFRDARVRSILTAYAIQGGAFKGRYLEVTTYRDGSQSINVLTRGFVLAAGKGSRLKPGSPSLLTGYPTYGYLKFKATFCAQRGVSCK